MLVTESMSVCYDGSWLASAYWTEVDSKYGTDNVDRADFSKHRLGNAYSKATDCPMADPP
jgi:hypothetical protein